MAKNNGCDYLTVRQAAALYDVPTSRIRRFIIKVAPELAHRVPDSRPKDGTAYRIDAAGLAKLMESPPPPLAKGRPRKPKPPARARPAPGREAHDGAE